MDGVLTAEYNLAKEYAAKNDKRRALLALRKRKFQEGLIAKVDLQLVTLEEMVYSQRYVPSCYAVLACMM